MADNYVIEIRLVGDHMSPETISSRDVGDLIASIEQMIASMVARDNPALGLSEDEVIVGLAGIQQGSYILQFKTPYEPEVTTVYSNIANSIANESYENWPVKSVDSLKRVRAFTRKYRTDAQLWTRKEAHRPLVSVTANTKIDLENPVILGRTTLYGMVIGVGGEDPPRARLRLLNGTVLSCNITRGQTLRIARELGQRLYSVVGVKGKARWNTRDMSLDYFLIEELTPYTPKSITQAVEALQRTASKYYEAVDDIDALVADARGNDEDI